MAKSTEYSIFGEEFQILTYQNSEARNHCFLLLIGLNFGPFPKAKALNSIKSDFKFHLTGKQVWRLDSKIINFK